MEQAKMTSTRIDGPTFQGVPIKFVESFDAPKSYIFNPEAQVGPNKGIEFFGAMSGKPVYRINGEHLDVVYTPPPPKLRHGIIYPLPGQPGGGSV